MKIKICPHFVGHMAKRLIDVAPDAKADAVKFQTYSAETLYSEEALVLPIKDVRW